MYFPDPRLQKESAPIERFDAEIKALARELLDTMYAHSGVGLAAPQIGVHRRMIVIDTGWPQGEERPRVVANPVIAQKRGSISYEEGCLSLPGYTAKVTRARWIKMRGFDAEGAPLELEAEELDAIALQHETDHLDGVLFIDRVARSVRDLYRKRLKKWQSEFYGTSAQRQKLLDGQGAML